MSSSNIMSPHPARCLRIALGGLPNFASGFSAGRPAVHLSNVWSSTRQYKTASPAGAPENDDSNPFNFVAKNGRHQRIMKFSRSPQNEPIWAYPSPSVQTVNMVYRINREHGLHRILAARRTCRCRGRRYVWKTSESGLSLTG